MLMLFKRDDELEATYVPHHWWSVGKKSKRKTTSIVYKQGRHALRARTFDTDSLTSVKDEIANGRASLHNATHDVLTMSTYIHMHPACVHVQHTETRGTSILLAFLARAPLDPQTLCAQCYTHAQGCGVVVVVVVVAMASAKIRAQSDNYFFETPRAAMVFTSDTRTAVTAKLPGHKSVARGRALIARLFRRSRVYR